MISFFLWCITGFSLTESIDLVWLGGELLLHLRRILDAHALGVDGLSHGREARIDKLGSGVEKASRLLFELDSERTLNTITFTGSLSCDRLRRSPVSMVESTVTGQRDHLALREKA